MLKRVLMILLYKRLLLVPRSGAARAASDSAWVSDGARGAGTDGIGIDGKKNAEQEENLQRHSGDSPVARAGPPRAAAAGSQLHTPILRPPLLPCPFSYGHQQSR